MTAHADPAVASETDAVAIERSWREADRFADVFDRHYPRIHGYATRRLGAALADDVASETFLIAFDRRHRYDVTYADAGPWLYGIAANLIARHRRQEVRRRCWSARPSPRRRSRSPLPATTSGSTPRTGSR